MSEATYYVVDEDKLSVSRHDDLECLESDPSWLWSRDGSYRKSRRLAYIDPVEAYRHLALFLDGLSNAAAKRACELERRQAMCRYGAWFASHDREPTYCTIASGADITQDKCNAQSQLGVSLCCISWTDLHPRQDTAYSDYLNRLRLRANAAWNQSVKNREEYDAVNVEIRRIFTLGWKSDVFTLPGNFENESPKEGS